jgi:uronate dehydrogenase
LSRIVVTGASGVIGTVLSKALADHELVPLDLPRGDVRRIDLGRAFEGAETIVHLAWNSRSESSGSGSIDPDNTLMCLRVYDAAVAAGGTRRVIMASSVHADRYREWSGPGLLSATDVPWPDSPYGANKVLMESLGRHFASAYGLDVICLRFGGVNTYNLKPTDPAELSVWLTHEDCEAVVRRCAEADVVPGRFIVMYAVSDNERPLVELENPLGWRPAPGRDGVGRPLPPPSPTFRNRLGRLRRRLSSV